MTSVFISYRRDDSGVAARLLYTELVARHGAGAVFMDLDDIGYGDDFAAVIDRELERAKVVVVVIGPNWHRILDERLRGDDWVRHEVQQALRLRGTGQVRIVPVLLDGTAWPGAALPAELAELQRLSAVKCRNASLKTDLAEVLQAVQGYSFEADRDRLGDDVTIHRRTPALALAAGVCVFLAAWLSLFDVLTLDTRLTALTVGWASAAPPPVDTAVLLAIDEKTVAAVGRPFDRTWRREHARVVAQAASAGAATLAFDVVMAEASPDDAALAQAATAAKARTPAAMPVIVGVQAQRSGAPAIAPTLAPALGFGLACAGERLGSVALMPLAVQPENDASKTPWPSLALAAFSGGGALQPLDAAARQARQVEVAVQQRARRVGYFADEQVRTPQAECSAVAAGDVVASQWVPSAAARVAVPRVPYEAVLAGDAAALRALAGRVVVVGVTLKGEDQFAVAGSAGAIAFGSELIVAQVQGLASGRAVRPLGGVALWLLMTALAFAGARLAITLRSRTPLQRRVAWAGAALLVVVASLAWFRSELQVVPLHHAVGALALGGLAARWLARRGKAKPAALGEANLAT